MIIGSYSLHLYCDNTKWHGDLLGHHVVTANNDLTNKSYRGGFAPYAGESYHECLRYARQDGWVIAHDRCHAYCPRCKKKRKNEGVMPRERNNEFVGHRSSA